MSDTIFIWVAIAGLLAATALLIGVLKRDLERRNVAPPHSGTDLTNMTILFHTMRDVLSQQKQLAEDFNRSLDRRVTEIRKVVDLIRKERELLRESREQLDRLLARARELAAQSSSAAYPVEPPVAPGANPTAAPLEAKRQSPPVEAERETEPQAYSPAPLPDDDLIENWTGMDFGAEPENEPAEEAPPEPVAPEDAAAARDAFRSLLNLSRPEAPSAVDAAPAEPAAEGNGRDTMHSVQQLVYEYSDAGMRVAEIAKELGVGKGEVRLILSLRAKKGL